MRRRGRRGRLTFPYSYTKQESRLHSYVDEEYYPLRYDTVQTDVEEYSSILLVEPQISHVGKHVH
jgi:hypothetical protein